MVLITSVKDDLSTFNVIDWLTFQKKEQYNSHYIKLVSMNFYKTDQYQIRPSCKPISKSIKYF
jgi:hypothetical protein